MEFRVHIGRLSRAPQQGDVLLRWLLGKPHHEVVRGGQPWLCVPNLTPRQCAGLHGLMTSRGLPNAAFQLVGMPCDRQEEAETYARALGAEEE